MPEKHGKFPLCALWSSRCWKFLVIFVDRGAQSAGYSKDFVLEIQGLQSSNCWRFLGCTLELARISQIAKLGSVDS